MVVLCRREIMSAADFIVSEHLNGKPIVEEPANPPRTYTTGDISKIVGVASRTVVKWMECHKTLPFYLVPGSRDRRVTKAALVAFLRSAEIWDSIADEVKRGMGLD